MAEHEDHSASEVAWRMLLNGWGYNWYRRENQMRADDLLIRGRASDCLDRASASLRQMEARHRREHLPPPSRAAPYPDPTRMAELRAIVAVRAAVEAVEGQVRGSAVPADDKVWQRHRDNSGLLSRLVESDTALIWATQAVEDAAGRETPDLDSVDRAVARIRAALGERRALLEYPPLEGPETSARFNV